MFEACSLFQQYLQTVPTHSLYKDKPFAAVRERVTALYGVIENARILYGQYTEFSFRLIKVVKIVTTIL
jgi:hypothetical protein